MLNVIISRQAGGDETARDREDAFASLCARVPDTRVLLVPSLYHVPEGSEVWAALAALEGPILVAAWLHPRPMTWLLRRHGVDAPDVTVLNLAAHPTAEACFAEARAAGLPPRGESWGGERAAGLPPRGEGWGRERTSGLPPRGESWGGRPTDDAPGSIEEIAAETSPRWYPVVDGSRCSGCTHCLQFCLFGVYTPGADGRPEVVNPDSCKAGCPACSRICPEGAITFPLYEKDEAIAGAPGKFMEPDLAARRMYYTRTQRSCPACGREGGADAAAHTAPPEALCPECGRTLPAQPSRGEPGVRPVPVCSSGPGALDDIDDLIETLDGLAARGRRS